MQLLLNLKMYIPDALTSVMDQVAELQEQIDKLTKKFQGCKKPGSAGKI